MRINIELDDVLVSEAMRLSGVANKDAVIHLALMRLVELEKKRHGNHQDFLAKYTRCPEQMDNLTPLSRNEVNERISDLC